MPKDFKDRIERIQNPDDPDRCQAVMPQGQCINKAVPHGDLCPVHGGHNQERGHDLRQMRNYRLQKWKWSQRLRELGESDQVKSLRDEIGILRVLMEERLVRIEDPTDLILQSGPISDLVMKIDKVVTSCHKLEGSMGQLLDKSAVLQFANEVIGIIADELSEIEDSEAMTSKIADRIIESLSNQTQNEEDE